MRYRSRLELPGCERGKRMLFIIRLPASTEHTSVDVTDRLQPGRPLQRATSQLATCQRFSWLRRAERH
jgi:hypothetical protein